MNYAFLTVFIKPAILIGGGIIVGLVFEKLIMDRLKRLATQTPWPGFEIIIKAMHSMTTFWFTLAGIYLALLDVPMEPGHRSLTENIMLIAAILSATIVTARIAVGFTNMYAKKAEGVLPSTSIFTNITEFIVFAVGILIILQSLGISITPILTALGVGGLAVALALQDTLSNLFSGLHLLASKQIKVGDYVKLDSGHEGHIVDINWRNTIIKALSNHIIVIPNSKIATSVIINYYLSDRAVSVSVPVLVSYDSDLERIEKITVEVATSVMRELPGGVPDFEPTVRYHTLGDSGISFNVHLRAREFVEQFAVKHEFIKRLHRRYAQEGIEIPFPIRTVYMKDKSK